jgi:hypothetical protein
MMSVQMTRIVAVLAFVAMCASLHEYRTHTELVQAVRKEMNLYRLLMSIGVAIGGLLILHTVSSLLPFTDKTILDLFISPVHAPRTAFERADMEARLPSSIALYLLLSSMIVLVLPMVLYLQERALRYGHTDRDEISHIAVLNTIITIFVGTSLSSAVAYYFIFVLLGRIYRSVYRTTWNRFRAENEQALTEAACHEKALLASTVYSILIFFSMGTLNELTFMAKLCGLTI